MITPQDLVAAIQPQILLIMHDSGYLYNYSDVSPSQIPLIPNQAATSNYFNQSTASQRFSFVPGSPGYTNDKDSASNLQMQGTLTGVTNNTQGQLTVFCRRETTSTLAIPFAVQTAGSANSRQIFRWNRSADSPASEFCWEETNSSGTVINRVGAADVSLNFTRWDFINTGIIKSILKGGIVQTPNVSVGANDGRWFANLPAPNRIQIGFATGLNAQGRYRFLCYTKNLLDVTMSALIDSYATQENLLA